MRHVPISAWCAVVLGAAGLLAYTVPSKAQAPARSKEIYNGQALDAEGIKLGGWGSGIAKEDTAQKSAGDSSIRIDTNGYYAGGRILFEEPRDVSAQKADPYGFLEFTVKFQPGVRRKQPSSSAPGGAGMPLGAPPGFPGEGAPDSGAGYPGVPGAAGGEEAPILPDTSRWKVLLICNEGSFVASNFPVLSMIPAREEGWFSVAIPFVAFKGMDGVETCNIKEIRIFGDTQDSFWIGEIRTTTDDEPIDVEPVDNAEVSVGEPVEFRAAATGGISPLQYVWDFDISNGLQEDAVGPVVVHTFRKPSPQAPGGSLGDVQPYLVTLTVKDLSGAKRPVRKTAEVIVNP